ncbi:MAG: PKD domain-containing protein, partial [Bacteroidetes bacterium]|nr:PKD domain-containing protein [Bacteroidota bacterium]
MKSIKYFFILIFILIFYTSHSQNEANIWYFGEYAGLDFNSGSPVAITNGAMDQIEGCASISDNNGSLLFYTDGLIVWNKDHQAMENGTGLLGNVSSTQSSIIVQKPDSDTLYYIFTVPDAYTAVGTLRYSIVDISQNGGLGKVITKNTFLHTPVTEKVTAVAHSNGQDIWVITHERETNNFCSFLVSSTGVNPTPVVSSVGAVHDYPLENYIGYLKTSPNGNFIACAVWGPLHLIEIFDFDNSAGQISNPISINSYLEPYGIEFSPDESRLYCGAEDEIIQFDLLAGSTTAIINSAITIAGSYVVDAGALQLAPDQKIYRTYHLGEYLDVINDPNELGSACNYVANDIYLNGKKGKLGLPTFFQSYFSSNITYQNECYGETTLFELSTSGSVQSVTWDFGDPASGSNNTSTLLQPGHVFTSSGTFNVTATIILTDGTTEVSSLNVTIFDLPQINLGNDTTMCSAATLLLDPGSGFSSYLWQDNSTNQLYTVTQPGTYWVTVTNGNSCSSTDSITVTVSPPFNITLGNDSIYCYQSSVTLHAGNTYASYLWQDGSADSILTVYNDGTYWVNVTDVNGCTGGDTISVSFFRNTVELGNDTTICSGNSVTLDAGMGFSNYLWNTGQTSQSIIASTSGFFNVEASYAHCVSYDIIELSFFPSATAFAGSNESICQYEQFDFSTCTILPLATNNDSIRWFGGSGTFSNSTQLHPIYTPGIGELGNITLSLIAYSSGDCPNDTSSMVLSIEAKPVSQINVLPNPVGCVGSPLSFEGSSTTNIASWIWDFNDGSGLINGQTVSHSFSSSGNYTVSLTVISSDGCSDTSSFSVLINPLPLADYSYLPNDSICVNELISFTDSSTSNIQSWEWDFDDGNNSTIQNPGHIYSTPGNYSVQLIVTDNNTCVDSLNTIVEVNQLPQPDFNILPNDTVCANQSITFDGFDIAGTQITDWQWDFGDGNLGTGQVFIHTYAVPGDYTITLSALNSNSCTEIHSKLVHIKSIPESNFTISPNDTSCLGELINLDAIDISGDIVSWDWQLGDGNAATGQNVSHIYSQQGNMNILSIFTNNLGCIDTAIHQRVVQDVNIWFNINQSPSCQNFNVDFVGVGDLVTFTPWEWNFGDGSATDIGHNVSHTYLLPDTLNVQLDVCSEQVIQQLIINATCQVDAGGLQRTCQDVYFNYANSATPPTAEGYAGVQWYSSGIGIFNDATLVAPTYFPHPSEGVTLNDTIIMTMIGYGLSPCQNDTSYAELIVIPGAYAQAGSDENSCFGVPYDFANSTDSSFATHYATIDWFTSGTGSFVNPNVQHPIYIPGSDEIGSITLTMVAANIINCDSIDDMILTIRPTYEVPVDITVCYYDSVYAQGEWRYTSGIFYDTLLSNYGCDSVIVTNFTVRDKIDKDFIISTGDSICLGESSIFTQTGNANLNTWYWDFGDGNSSFDPNPTHTYTASGIYDVIFSYTDENGCSDSAVQQASVFDLPDVFFTSSMNDACVNTSINFSGGSNSNIQSWDWDFGDGQTGTGQNISHVYTTWGFLTVTLIVTDINGCFETTFDNITIAQPPIADFTYEIALCDSLQFSDLSESPPGYNLVTWYWDFGDGITSNLQNPSHQYPSNTTPGGEVYNVTLTVVADSNGFMCSDSIVLPVTVPSLPDIFFTYTPDPSCLGDSTYF